MKLYRYYYEDGEYGIGFLAYLHDIIYYKIKKDDRKFINSSYHDYLVYTEFRLTALFEDELRAPPSEIYNQYEFARSYFTQKGNRKFKKRVREISKFIEQNFNENILTRAVEIPDDATYILFKDEYQVVIDEEKCSQYLSEFRLKEFLDQKVSL